MDKTIKTSKPVYLLSVLILIISLLTFIQAIKLKSSFTQTAIITYSIISICSGITGLIKNRKIETVYYSLVLTAISIIMIICNNIILLSPFLLISQVAVCVLSITQVNNLLKDYFISKMMDLKLSAPGSVKNKYMIDISLSVFATGAIISSGILLILQTIRICHETTSISIQMLILLVLSILLIITGLFLNIQKTVTESNIYKKSKLANRIVIIVVACVIAATIYMCLDNKSLLSLTADTISNNTSFIVFKFPVCFCIIICLSYIPILRYRYTDFSLDALQKWENKKIFTGIRGKYIQDIYDKNIKIITEMSTDSIIFFETLNLSNELLSCLLLNPANKNTSSEEWIEKIKDAIITGAQNEDIKIANTYQHVAKEIEESGLLPKSMFYDTTLLASLLCNPPLSNEYKDFKNIPPKGNRKVEVKSIHECINKIREKRNMIHKFYPSTKNEKSNKIAFDVYRALNACFISIIESGYYAKNKEALASVMKKISDFDAEHRNCMTFKNLNKRRYLEMLYGESIKIESDMLYNCLTLNIDEKKIETKNPDIQLFDVNSEEKILYIKTLLEKIAKLSDEIDQGLNVNLFRVNIAFGVDDEEAIEIFKERIALPEIASKLKKINNKENLNLTHDELTDERFLRHLLILQVFVDSNNVRMIHENRKLLKTISKRTGFYMTHPMEQIRQNRNQIHQFNPDNTSWLSNNISDKLVAGKDFLSLGPISIKESLKLKTIADIQENPVPWLYTELYHQKLRYMKHRLNNCEELRQKIHISYPT